uniref:trypsin n=1 Tax=Cyprinus carpio carpio TaxID=630221 RepID=A0A9J7ZXK1_CYPCA
MKECSLFSCQVFSKLFRHYRRNSELLSWKKGIAKIGGLTPLTLRTVKLPIVSTSKCNSSNSFSGNITTNMICAGSSTGGKDACKGDSGGPLVCDGRVYGLVSWGNVCGDSRFPGVYTAVSRFRRWIDQTIYNPYSQCLKSAGLFSRED